MEDGSPLHSQEAAMGAISDKIKGKAMQIEGKLTGDKVRMIEGVVREKQGQVEGVVARTGRKLKRVARKIRNA
jgi:uncharacterized protein YjbJ (UPF0337 family)